MAEWSEIEKLMGRLVEDLPAAGTDRPGALRAPWPREDLPGRPGEPVLHMFRPPPGLRLRLNIDG